MGGSTNRIYPKANTTAQWFEPLYDRATFDRIDKFLLHTTETTGWPGYSKVTKGDSAPTITYHPRLREFRQHNYINTSARALVDPSSTPVRENRDNVVQIEIICYTDLIKAESVGGLKVTDLTDEHLQDIAEFYRWLNTEWGCPIQCTLEFPPYRPYKNVRLTSSQYDAYKGLLGHMHASGNTHTDPGNINVGKIMKFALGLTTPVEDDMPTPAELWSYPLGKNPADPTIDSNAGNALAIARNYTYHNYVMLRAITEKLGTPVDVDESAIAADLLASLGPALNTLVKDAVVSVLESVQNDSVVSPTEIADAVATRLAERLVS